jgi:L-lactate dehydrogenase complex protein LldG
MSRGAGSRETILAKVRSALPQSSPLPDVLTPGRWQTFPDPTRRFQEVVASVGGQVICVPTLAEAARHLESLAVWTAAAVRCSVVPGLGDSSFDLNAVTDPHVLENVDFAVLRGHLAVAENGAVWVRDDTLQHRVLYFIPQHMALAVPAAAVVHNMHEAYGRIEVGRHPFAGFISGPSKTADIEQSLVIGAHGARSLTVYLIEELSEQ